MNRPKTPPASKVAHANHEVLDVVRTRWSPRSFADRPVEPEKIRRLLEAARWTMSSRNEQPWRYVIARKEDPEAYDRLFHCLNEKNQAWAHLAPVLMLSLYKTTYSKSGEHNRVALHDLGAASAALTFQARALDLYVHPMAGIRPEVARTTYNVPEGVVPVTVMAVGYLGNPDQLPKDRRDAERRPRSREPLSAFVFEKTWGQAAALVERE